MLCVHVTSVLCCSVLSSAIVVASCQMCTPDNKNYYCHHNGDQLHVIDTLCTIERDVPAAVNIGSCTLSTVDDDVSHPDYDDDDDGDS